MQRISGFSAIAGRYDALLLDLWGVIHDGTHLYPGVPETLAVLRKERKQIVFISNAPRRAWRVVEVLEKLGIGTSLYDHAISSGEVAFGWFRVQGNVGKRYVFIGPDRDSGLLDGLDYQKTNSLEEADFLLNAGFGSEVEALDDWNALLRDAARRALLMVCVNPDLEVVKQSGARFPCAGEIARSYEALGGRVRYFGKPYPEIYNAALALFKSVGRSRILAVGDSLITDIKGAVDMGLDSLLITGGILKGERIETLCERECVAPTYVSDRFGW